VALTLALADVLADLGVDCVTVANDHALDFGARALGTEAREEGGRVVVG